MDDLIEKIKEVEKEARNIVLNAENKAYEILDEAKFQANSKLDKARTGAYSTYMQSLKNRIDEANQKKEDMLNKRIQDFYNQLGDVVGKKKTITETLEKKIKSWIN